MLAEQILSLKKLAFCLGVSIDSLKLVAESKADYYRPYTVTEKKRDGRTKERKIDNPNKALRNIQRRINKKILVNACKALPSYTTGSIPKRSAYQNARPHVKREAMLLVDISDCFPSIKATDVYGVYKSVFGCSPPVANLLTKLTTYGDRLPQGAPTSSSLCNLVLAPLAARLDDLATTNDLVFTQYVDDLTFSGGYESLKAIENQVITTIEQNGLKVSRRKLKLVKHKNRMEVTGLVVNRSVSVGRKYLRKVQRDIMKPRSNEASVRGKISYVKSVSQSHARKLNERLSKVLSSRNQSN